MRIVSAVFALTALFVQPITRGEDFKPDDEGFIRDWLLLGPIPVAAGQGNTELENQQIPEEGKLEPLEGGVIKVRGKELAWKAVQTAEFFFDLNELLGGRFENCAGYAVCFIDSAAEFKDLTLSIGSNDQSKLYLNGREMLKSTETRSVEKDSNETKNVTLKKGVNTVVFKILNDKNNWQGALRFKSADGTPVKNITIKLKR